LEQTPSREERIVSASCSDLLLDEVRHGQDPLPSSDLGSAADLANVKLPSPFDGLGEEPLV